MPNISSILLGVIAALGLALCVCGLLLWIDGAKIDTLKADNKALTTANEGFKTATDEQNAKIQKLKDDEQALTDAAAKAQKLAAQQDAVLQGALTRLQAVKPSSNACSAANTLFNQYIGGK